MTAATSVVKLRVVLGTAGTLFGLVSVIVVADAGIFDANEPFVWMTDLAAGLAFVALAAYAIPAAPSVARLASCMALAWFAGSILPFAVFWHRGVVIHVLLAYPALLPRSRSSRAAVLIGYAASATPFIWRDEALSAALAVAVLAMVAGQKTGSRGRRSRIVVLGAAAAFAIAVTAGSVARSVVEHNAAVIPALIAYSLVIAGIAVVLGIGLRRADRVQLTDLVVELGEYPSGTLRDLLARAVGDPSLTVGYWNRAKGAYLDSAGIPLEPPRAGDMRASTPIARDGSPFVLIVHDESVLDDPLLVSAAATAAQLTAANAQLHSELRLRVDEVAASRRRILSSADEERRRLQGELQGTVSAPLEELARRLAAVAPPSEDAAESAVGTARTLLDRAMGELNEIGSGLHPKELHRGLRAAVAALADRCPVPVIVSVVALRFSPEIEAAAYYTCAEALANSVRYSGASSISIDVTVRAGDLLIVVADDGTGGADPTRGTGLSGLADRVDAVGGRFVVDSPPGGGTRVSATIPIA